MQVDVGDVARHRSGAFGEYHAYRRNIRAPVDAQRHIAVAETAHRSRRVAVEEALHVRQKAHELAIVPLLERGPGIAELVVDERPRVSGQPLKKRVGGLAAVGLSRRADLDGPQARSAGSGAPSSLTFGGETRTDPAGRTWWVAMLLRSRRAAAVLQAMSAQRIDCRCQFSDSVSPGCSTRNVRASRCDPDDRVAEWCVTLRKWTAGVGKPVLPTHADTQSWPRLVRSREFFRRQRARERASSTCSVDGTAIAASRGRPDASRLSTASNSRSSRASGSNMPRAAA